jgi:hypothetical protein
VDSGDLRAGDELLLRDGRTVPVEAVRTGSYHDAVYNIAVAELQCYSVGRSGVLVHNTNSGEVPGEYAPNPRAECRDSPGYPKRK